MSEINVNDDVALQELVVQLNNLQSIVNQIVMIRKENMFRYLSKKSRNQLLDGLIEMSGSVEDAAKAAYRSIKKIKRVALPDEVADLLITHRRVEAIAFAPEVTGNPPVNSQDDEQ